MIKNGILIIFLAMAFSCTKKVGKEAYNFYYKDWVPDTTIATYYDTLKIDMDGDNKYDVQFSSYKYFLFSSSSGSYYNTFLDATSTDNSVSLSGGTGNRNSYGSQGMPIGFNDKISEKLTWESRLTLKGSILNLGQAGWWNSASRNYICVKKTNSSGINYGWIEANSGGEPNLTLYQQAFNKNYNQIIKVGQTQ